MLQLRILVLKDGPWYVAQCLEYDLGAEAKSLDDALYEMEKTVVAQIFFDLKHGRQPFSTLSPAPPTYLEMFCRADKKSVDQPRLPRFQMPPMAPAYESDVRVCCA